MKISKTEWSINKLSKMYKNRALSFDMPIQRKENIWDDKRKSLLIHSILSRYPIPFLYALKKGKEYNFLDGKQRLVTVFQFLDGKFKLHKETPSFNGVELAGKGFNDFSEDIRFQLEDGLFDIIKIEDASDKEAEEMFYRLNNGVPLKQIETTRAVLGNKHLSYIETIAKTPFFASKINLSKTARQRYTDQELILQVLALVHNADTGFSGKELESFVKQQLKSVDLRNELQSRVENACYYLNEAFPRKRGKERILKKVHVPMLVKLVLDIQDKQLPIFPSEFGEWAKDFFSNIPEEYKMASLQGSAQKENVHTRLRVMTTAFAQHLKDSGKVELKYNPPLDEILAQVIPISDVGENSQTSVG